MKNKLKDYWQKLVHLNDSPHKVALGFAIGAFIGVFPTFGLGGILAIAIAGVLRLSYVAAVAGAALIMNPLTAPFFWLASAFIGGLIFRIDYRLILPALQNGNALKTLGNIAIVYLVGNFVVSTLVAVISYYAIRYIFPKINKRAETAQKGEGL